MMGQSKRIESPDVDPHNYSKLIFDKGAKAIKCRIVFSTNGSGTTRDPYETNKQTT